MYRVNPSLALCFPVQTLTELRSSYASIKDELSGRMPLGLTLNPFSFLSFFLTVPPPPPG